MSNERRRLGDPLTSATVRVLMKQGYTLHEHTPDNGEIYFTLDHVHQVRVSAEIINAMIKKRELKTALPGTIVLALASPTTSEQTPPRDPSGSLAW